MTLLLATTIVESGLDLPNCKYHDYCIVLTCLGYLSSINYVDALAVQRSRGYAYFTISPKRSLSTPAMKRLEVMQSLDTLGAGFTLASHDLDIRGAGNSIG